MTETFCGVEICPAFRFFVLTPREPTMRLWLDEREERCVLLDADDYAYFSRWLWSPKLSRGGWKCYAFRCESKWQDSFGQRAKKNSSIYLHVEILKRSGAVPLSPRHTIVDHRNSDSLDCRRQNLRWATPSMNRLNLHGRMPHDLVEG